MTVLHPAAEKNRMNENANTDATAGLITKCINKNGRKGKRNDTFQLFSRKPSTPTPREGI